MGMPSGMAVQIPKELYWLAVWIYMYRLICISTMVNVDAALVRQEASMYDLEKGGPDITRTIQMRKKKNHQSIMENASQAITTGKVCKM